MHRKMRKGKDVSRLDFVPNLDIYQVQLMLIGHLYH